MIYFYIFTGFLNLAIATCMWFRDNRVVEVRTQHHSVTKNDKGDIVATNLSSEIHEYYELRNY